MLKRILIQKKFADFIYRSYVSSINVNAKSLNSIKVRAKDYLSANYDENVKLTCIDKSGQEIQPGELKSMKVQSTDDIFKMSCDDLKEISVIVEIPLSSSPEAEINIEAGNSSMVQIENLQTKSIKVDLNHGNVMLKNLKSDLIDVEIDHGNISTKSMMLGKKIDFEAKNGDIVMEKSQGDNLKIEAMNVSIESCYNTTSSISSTQSAILKSFHGKSSIKSSGDVFKLSGFSGTIKADLNNSKVDIQLSELFDKNEIHSSNPEAIINLGLSEEILNETSLSISSNCEIKNLVLDLLMCQKTEKSFKIRKENPRAVNELKMSVTNGKSLNLSKMSWIDTLQLKQTIGS